MNRTDIKQHDVFVSWTGDDRELKNRIVDYLESNGITCLESDHGCSGDFNQWSIEAVGACTVFLLLFTENTLNSRLVPVEIEAYKKLDDHKNRIVPVCSSMELYKDDPWGINEYASAVIMDEDGLSESNLRSILDKAQALIINSLDREYKKAVKPDYMKLFALSGGVGFADSEYDFSKLYIPRTLIELNDNNGVIASYDSPEELCDCDDIVFISGEAGSGKSSYIEQIKGSADDFTICIVLKCHRMVLSGETVTEAMYNEFRRRCGSRYYFTSQDFHALLNNRRLLLVLDGLDEIPTKEGTRSFLSKVGEYYSINSDNTTLILTSRNPNDASLVAVCGKKPRRFCLERLSETEIRTLADNLFILFDSPEKGADFYSGISGMSEEIRTNPLLITQLAIIYQDSGTIPETIMDICDAIAEISFNLERNSSVTDIPEAYRNMVLHELPGILKSFSIEQYNLRSQGRYVDTQKVFAHVLKKKYKDESSDRGAFLAEYLQNRAILTDGEFFHKIFIEYFTAAGYYDLVFDDYDEIEDTEKLSELFSHYSEPYWSTVISFFLMKADKNTDERTTEALYTLITGMDVTDYTLLFETCADLLRNKEKALSVLVSDILYKSAQKIYPPYGPLFWYVPTFDLYETAVLALDAMRDRDFFAEMLALVRDVCFIFGQYRTLNDVTDRADALGIYNAAKPSLSGVRDALCELFCTGSSDSEEGKVIYPRCFNTDETRSMMENDYGLWNRQFVPFEDELGLYEHECYNEFNGELIGFVSCPYHKPKIQSRFEKEKVDRVLGLALTPTVNVVFTYLSIYRKSLKVIYFPENCSNFSDDFYLHLDLLYVPFWSERYLAYLKDKETLVIPGFVEEIGPFSFMNFKKVKKIVLCEGIKRIKNYSFNRCADLQILEFPRGLDHFDFRGKLKKLKTVIVPFEELRDYLSAIEEAGLEYEVGKTENGKTEILLKTAAPSNARKKEEVDRHTVEDIRIKRGDKFGTSAFEGSKKLKRIKLPTSMRKIPKKAFKNCTSLVDVMMPDALSEIGDSAFEGCVSLWRIFLPDTLKYIGKGAFKGCIALKKVFLPDSLMFIDDEAFAGCVSLEEVHLPINIMRVSPSAFKDCASLKKVLMPYGFRIDLSMLPNVSCGYYRTREQAGSSVDEKLLVPKPDILFPDGDEFSGLLIVTDDTQLYPSEYEFVMSISRVEVADGVTAIPKRCFLGCGNLRTVILPEKLRKIGKEAFLNCKKLEEISFPHDLRSIGEYAFYECRSLKEVRFGPNLVQIDKCAFQGCSSLESVELPNTIRRIGKNAFKDCVNLKSVRISANFMDEVESIFGDIDHDIITFIY